VDWLKDYSYLAGWLAIPVAFIVAFVQNKDKKLSEVDWSRLLIYFTFLVAVAATFTPAFDKTARDAARTIVFMILGFLIVDIKR
jgi:hypothetical protein